MNNRIKNYVDVLFKEIPRSKRASELKEEMLANMEERYADYLREGKTDTQAYSLVVANLGDVDELLKEVMPDAEFKKEANHYRRRNALWTAISVMLYILGTAFLIIISACGEFVQQGVNEELYGTTGVVILLLFAAVATGILIYVNMSTPVEFRDFDEQEKRRNETPAMKAFESIYWSAVTAVYLLVSFLSSEWGITWIIWPVAAVLSSIIETVVQLRRGYDK